MVEEDARIARRLTAPSGLTLVALVVALCFLAGAIGWTLGRGRPPGRGSVDVGFLYDMSAHHHQAIEMAQIEMARGTVADVKTFADEILRYQSYELGLMSQKLSEWGYDIGNAPASAMRWMGHTTLAEDMPGMASPAELRLLQDGPDPDAVFLALMSDHHAGGVAMAAYAAEHGRDGDVRELAGRIARAQRFEVKELLAAAIRNRLDRSPGGVDVSRYDPLTGSLTTEAADHGSHE